MAPTGGMAVEKPFKPTEMPSEPKLGHGFPSNKHPEKDGPLQGKKGSGKLENPQAFPFWRVGGNCG